MKRVRVLFIGRHAEVLERTLASLKRLPVKTEGAVAGALMVPYALWVAFAATLNFTIWRLNS